MMNNLLLRTVDDIGTKRSHVRHDGRDKTRVSLVLAFSSLGHMLLPMFIIKGKPDSAISLKKLDPLIAKFGDRALFALALRATATTSTTRRFLEESVGEYTRRHGVKYPIIHYDAFPGHGYNSHSGEYDPALENFVNRVGLPTAPPQVAHVPANHTGKVQFGDVIMHRPLKAALRKMEATQRVNKALAILKCAESGAAGEKAMEKMDLTFHMTEPQARMAFVENVMAILYGPTFPSQLIINGFKSCGISNSLDGSEANLVTVGSQIFNIKRK
jgi:hypothetical protein